MAWTQSNQGALEIVSVAEAKFLTPNLDGLYDSSYKSVCMPYKFRDLEVT